MDVDGLVVDLFELIEHSLDDFPEDGASDLDEVLGLERWTDDLVLVLPIATVREDEVDSEELST